MNSATNQTWIQNMMTTRFWDNSLKEYLVSLIVLVITLAVVLIFHRVLLAKIRKKAEQSKTKLDDFIVRQIGRTFLPLLYYGALFLATRNLKLSAGVDKVINTLGIVLLVFLTVRLLSRFFRYWLENYYSKKEKDPGKISTVKGVMPAINVVLWVIGAIFLLDNLGFKISTIVAGLGIGGVAVALGAQAVLGDLFSYFSILMDRPFEVGDFIILGDYMGTVEKIGVKTTRIRSLGGEQIILSNTDLTGSRVRNYKRMKTRRAVFQFGIVYETPVAKIKEIPDIVKKICAEVEDIVFDRAHFFKYGDFSLDFEVVYIVQNGDYNRYMDIQQYLNLRLFEELSKKKVEFAYPTQVVHMVK